MTTASNPDLATPSLPGRAGPEHRVKVLRSWPEGIDLPSYSPWRRIPEWEPHGLWLRDRPQVEWPDTLFAVNRAPWLLRGMLVLGLILGQATMGGHLGAHLWAAALTVVLAGWVEWWQRWDLSTLGRRLLIIAVQLGLIAGIITVSPIGGIIIWTHYMVCGTFFTGFGLLTSLAASCVLITAVQVGGFAHLGGSWTLTVGLFLFDLAIGIGSIAMANRREEAVLRRNETTRQLLIEQHRNEELQEQLIAQARETGVRDERARLARELHDTVAQGLVAVVTQLEAIPDDALDVSARHRVANAKALAREGLGEARRAVNALRPPALDGVALPDAVRRMLDDWSSVNGIAGALTVAGEPRELAADPELVRVLQEALSNVARHASAGNVAVSVDYLDDEVLLDIHDDGVGFAVDGTDGPSEAGGRGLPGMAERMRLAGGSFGVESEPGAGCVVTAVVPG
ncbi:sensor histidine kinase [Nakamurella panacisegetis]|uniref:sensor histidine kinase n=1 Tax=Nakamurella panacisegetis TaxID=1090615 RepID=UPI00155FCC98|nr:sensor histidine kinase [Nakamurella panacisegetis]